METLEKTLQQNLDWAIDRIHTICEDDIENAHSIQAEFREWFSQNGLHHEVISLEFIGD